MQRWVFPLVRPAISDQRWAPVISLAAFRKLRMTELRNPPLWTAFTTTFAPILSRSKRCSFFALRFGGFPSQHPTWSLLRSRLPASQQPFSAIPWAADLFGVILPCCFPAFKSAICALLLILPVRVEVFRTFKTVILPTKQPLCTRSSCLEYPLFQQTATW